MIPKKITRHLEKKKIKFEIVPHKKVYTAYDLAQTLGEKLDKVVKSLLVKVEFPKVKKRGPQYYVVVVPASYRVSLEKIKKSLDAAKVELAPEKVMKRLGMTPGALSPFVSLYKNVGLLIDKALERTQKALVGAESFTESLRIQMKDLIRAEKPIKAVIKEKAKPAKAKK